SARGHVAHSHLHSFPTRRSSYLALIRRLFPPLRPQNRLCLSQKRNDITRQRWVALCTILRCDALAIGKGGTAGICPAITRSRLRSEEHTSELQSRENLVCRLLLE